MKDYGIYMQIPDQGSTIGCAAGMAQSAQSCYWDFSCRWRARTARARSTGLAAT